MGKNILKFPDNTFHSSAGLIFKQGSKKGQSNGVVSENFVVHVGKRFGQRVIQGHGRGLNKVQISLEKGQIMLLPHSQVNKKSVKKN